MESELFNVKDYIHSVFSTNGTKGALPLTVFMKDYEDLSGSPLPFLEHGYRSAKDFLASLSDTVALRAGRWETTVSCLSDTKSEHIAVLVTNQDSSKRKRSNRGRPPSRPTVGGRNQSSSYSSANNRYAPSLKKYNTSYNTTSNHKVPSLVDVSDFRFANKPSASSYSRWASNNRSDAEKTMPIRTSQSASATLSLPTQWQHAAKRVVSATKNVDLNLPTCNDYVESEMHENSVSESPEVVHTKMESADVTVREPSPINIVDATNEAPEELTEVCTSDVSATGTTNASLSPGSRIHSKFTKNNATSMQQQHQQRPFFKPPVTMPFQMGMPRVVSPLASLHMNIMNLLLRYQRGINLANFNEVFCQNFNYWITPSVYGYMTLFELLSNIPFVTLRHTGNALMVLHNQNAYIGPRIFQPQPVPFMFGHMPCAVPQGHFAPPLPAFSKPMFQKEAPVNSVHKSPLQSTMPDETLCPALEAVRIRENVTPICAVNPPPGFKEKIPVDDAINISKPVQKYHSHPPGFTKFPDVSNVLSNDERRRFDFQATDKSSPELVHDETRSDSPFVSVSDNGDATSTNLASHRKTVKKVSDKINSVMKSVFRQILAANPSGIFLNDLPAEYKKITNLTLHVTEYGCHSVLELVGFIPDVFKIRRTHDASDWILSNPESDSQVEAFDETSHPTSLPVSDIKISEGLQNRIVNVVCMFPNGLVESDFLHYYKVLYDEDFVFSASTGNNLRAIFQSLSRILSINYTDDDIMVIHALNDEGSELNCQKLPEAPSVATCKIRSDVANPEDVFVRETCYMKQEAGDYVKVMVSHVAHPGRFYIQLQGKSTSRALDDLMVALRISYSAPDAKDYTLPSSRIAPGKICVALYNKDGNWYRAIIVDTQYGTNVKLLYVDFGNTEVVDVNYLYLVKKEFLTLPCQAIASKLYDCLPISGPLYSPAAVKRFRKLTEGKRLIAQLCQWEASNNPKENMLIVNLCDTSSEQDVYINDDLVQHNLAKYAPKESEFDVVQEQATDMQTAYETSISRSRPDEDGIVIYWNVSGNKITRHTLLKSDVHVVYLKSSLYVPTFEVSKYIWDYDILFRRLLIIKYKVEFVVVSKEMDPALYDHLKRLQVGVKQQTETSTKITLLTLNSVPKLVTIFQSENRRCESIAFAFEELYQSLTRN